MVVEGVWWRFESPHTKAMHKTSCVILLICTCDHCSSSFVIEFKDESQTVSDGTHVDQDNGHRRHKGTSDLLSTVTVGQDIASDSHYRDSMTSSGSDHGTATTSGGHQEVLSQDKNGCFSRALLRDRDELSSTGSSKSQSTEDKEERRGNTCALSFCFPKQSIHITSLPT